MICSYGCLAYPGGKKEEGICEKIIQVWLMKDETCQEAIHVTDEGWNHSSVTAEWWNM